MRNEVESASGGDKKFSSLRKFNLWMALLHFGQGVAMLWLSNSFELPVMSSYLKFDLVTKSLQPNPSVLFSLKIGPMIAIFLFISSLAHLFVGTVFNSWYNKNLARGINFARWIEYSFSSSIMIVVIAMLVGIYDIGALILFVSLLMTSEWPLLDEISLMFTRAIWSKDTHQSQLDRSYLRHTGGAFDQISFSSGLLSLVGVTSVLMVT